MTTVGGHVEVALDEIDGYVTLKDGANGLEVEVGAAEVERYTLAEASELAAALLTVVTIAREGLRLGA